MDSPYLQSAPQPQRVRTNSNLSVRSIDQRSGIRKQSFDRSRSVSTSQVDRLQHLALGPCEPQDIETLPTTTSGFQWITPSHSPQPQHIFPDPSIEAFPTWSVPTPPRSDSGIPTVSIGASEEAIAADISTSQGFAYDLQSTSAEMSSLGLLLPSQYGGTGMFESEPSSYNMEQNYMPPMKVSQPTTSMGQSAYAHTVSSSPALYQSRSVPEASRGSRRHSELPAGDQAYGQNYRRISSPYEGSTNTQYSAPPSQNIPSISGLTQSPMPSPHVGTYPGADAMPQHNSVSRSPGLYDTGMYQQPYTTSPGSTQLYAPAQSLSYPPAFMGSSGPDAPSKPLSSESSIRVINQRPKPQCWEHGCNGRQFSTFSNLLRHQREKSGTAPKSYCPKCGAEFTRTTARNGHLAHDKCTKQRSESDDS